MKKILTKISLILVMVIIICQTWPAIQAKAASLPGLKYTSKVIYIDGDSLGKYTDNCWIPSQNTTGYSAKYQVTSGDNLITVSKNGKVTATGNGVGSAVVKITYMKTGEKDTTANFTVNVRRNAIDVKLTAKSLGLLDEGINIGDAVKFEAAKSYDGSYAKGHYGLDNYRGVVNDSLKIESLTPDIATTNGLTLTAKKVGTAKFVVKAYQFGDDRPTGVVSMIYSIEIKDPQPTPTPTPLVSVKQTGVTTIELSTNTTYTTAPTTSNIKVNKMTTNYSIDIRSITVDSTDKTKLIIETYSSLNDNTAYEVVYNNEKYEFISSDGKIDTLRISPTQIEEMVETEIYVSCYDKKGVFLGKYDMTTAYNVTGLELTITSDYGYPSGNKFQLYNVGNTARAKAVYRTGNYDNYGNEIGTITTEATIVATKATPVTVGPYQYTIASLMPGYSSLTSSNNNIFIEVGQQDKYIYFYVKNSKGEDVSYEYTLSSSNIDLLIVGDTIPQSTGIAADIYAVSSSTTNVNAFVLVSKNNSVVHSLPVTIRPEGKLGKLELDKYTLNLANTSVSKEVVKISLYDQYNQKLSDEYPTITLLNVPNTSMRNTIESSLQTYAEAGLGKVFFCAIGLDPGTYSFKVQYGDYSRVVSITVTKPNDNISSTYGLVLSANTIDSAVSSSDTSNKEITFRLAERKGNIVVGYLSASSGITPVIKDSSGKIYYPTVSADSSDTWVFVVTDIGSNPVNKIAKGSYTVSVTYNKVEYKQTFTVSDSQAGVLTGLVSSTITSPGTWGEALTAAFDFTYNGANVDSTITTVTYTSSGGNGNASYSSWIGTGTYHVQTVTMNIPIGAYNVPVTVTVGRSFTVK